MKHLAFIDMDDTLLGPDKTISIENLHALDRLRAAGIEIVIASGRHHKNLGQYRDDIRGMDWLISSHGSAVESLQTGEVILDHTLPAELVRVICQRAKQEGVGIIAYHRDGAYIEQASEWTDLHVRRTGWTLSVRDFETLPPEGFQKILWVEHESCLTALAPVMQAEFKGRAQVLQTEPELLEFFSPQTNKAVGAQALIERRGLSQDRTLAFGDGCNDLELLRWAGVSVAMAHGCEAARQAAQWVSPSAALPRVAFAGAVDLALERVG